MKATSATLAALLLAGCASVPAVTVDPLTHPGTGERWPEPTVRTEKLVVIAECKTKGNIGWHRSLTWGGKTLLKVQKQCKEA